jgi:hypothetical protein
MDRLLEPPDTSKMPQQFEFAQVNIKSEPLDDYESSEEEQPYDLSIKKRVEPETKEETEMREETETSNDQEDTEDNIEEEMHNFLEVVSILL